MISLKSIQTEIDASYLYKIFLKTRMMRLPFLSELEN
jgi:hypothetical protein